MLRKFVKGVIAVCGMLWLVGGNVFAADLQLNPETLMRIRDKSGGSYLKAEEVFLGINDEKFTFDDVENCIKKYGLDYEWSCSEKDAEAGFTMHNLVCNVWFFEGTSGDDGLTEEYMNICENANSEAELSELLRQVELDRNTFVHICFISLPVWNEQSMQWVDTFPESSRDALIERISIINHGGYTLKEGWQWEENFWRYYENDKWITGFKWIDNELYHFETDGSLSHNKFAVIDGRKYHFNGNWADRGWQTLEENGQTSWYYFDMSDAHALLGYQAGIEGDSYKYFFWQDGFTDRNGKTYPAGALACGSAGADLWVFENGNPVYVVDEAGHLYVNMEKEFNGQQYRIDGDGKVAPVKTIFEQRLEAFRQNHPQGSQGPEKYDDSWTCVAYAKMACYEMFQTKWSNWTKVAREQDPTLENLSVGDYLLFARGKGEDTHSIFVTGIEGDTIYYTDSNWIHPNIVRWDNAISKQELLTNEERWYLSYRHAPEDVYKEVMERE